MLRTLLTGFSILALALAVVVWSSASRPLAPDVAFRTLDGRDLRLADLRGRPVLVNFWATTCSVCVREMPHLAELQGRLAGHALAVVAVAMPYDPPSRVVEFSRRMELPFPVALDLDAALVRAFGDVAATPTTILIDRDGRVAARRVGAWDTEDIAAHVQALADEKS